MRSAPLVRRIPHALPALAAFALLTAAAIDRHREPAQRAVAPDALVYPECTLPLQSANGADSSWLMPSNGGATQPVLGIANMAACSLGTVPGYHYLGYVHVRVLQWDPATLAPDPTSVALRSGSIYISSGYTNVYLGAVGCNWVPPLVNKRLPGLAQAPGEYVALDCMDNLHTYSNQPDLSMQYASAGDPSLPVGLRFTSASAQRTVLPGAHPVIPHVVCGGDRALQELYVVQSVTDCSDTVDTSVADVVQRFRVPQECQLRWVEVAATSQLPSWPYMTGSIAILDAAGQSTPPASMGPGLVSAAFTQPLADVWTSHYDFDRVITLEPDHDYWLWVRTGHQMGLHEKPRSGLEGAAFDAAIGPLCARNDTAGAWTAVPSRALAFKLVGVPLGTIGVAPPTRGAGALALRARPNPARGAVTLAWSGARGEVRFEVVDARGRRVAAGTGSASASGEWRWSASPTAATPLPAGVYFVRARDAAGQQASERVVIAR